MTDRVEGTTVHLVDIHLTGAKAGRLIAETMGIACG